MQLASKAAIGFLLVAITVAPLAGESPAAAPARQPAAGCHQSSPTVPAPLPASHQCCAAGHDPAVPQQAFSAPPLAAQPAPRSLDPLPLAAGAPPTRAILAIPGGDPPTPSPLRL